MPRPIIPNTCGQQDELISTLVGLNNQVTRLLRSNVFNVFVLQTSKKQEHAQLHSVSIISDKEVRGTAETRKRRRNKLLLLPFFITPGFNLLFKQRYNLQDLAGVLSERHHFHSIRSQIWCPAGVSVPLKFLHFTKNAALFTTIIWQIMFTFLRDVVPSLHRSLLRHNQLLPPLFLTVLSSWIVVDFLFSNFPPIFLWPLDIFFTPVSPWLCCSWLLSVSLPPI